MSRQREAGRGEERGITIDGTSYTSRHVLIIAELGTSHGADPVKARELIDAAAEAGADCVKFQIVYAHEILHPLTGEVALPGGRIPLYDRFKALERDPAFYGELKDYAESRGLLFLCTPFGLGSARELLALGPKVLKIASPELNYSALLRELGASGLPILLSTGVSRLGDIEEAAALLEGTEYCILHCVTAYPAPAEDYNLRILGNLGGIFGAPVGVSDHSEDPELVPVLATAMGAAVIEKHFCLSRTDPGLDDPIALPPGDFVRMTRGVRKAEALGQEAVLNAVGRERGVPLREAVLGTGIKGLAPSEAANYGRTNRSLHAVRAIRAGERIEAPAVAVLRTEKILRPGLPPSWESAVVGRRAAQDIPAGEGIRFEDLS